jgi:translocation and assembly module TamA
VSVTLDRGEDRQRVDGRQADDGWVTAPVRVQLRERAPYQVTLTASGYSTNTGARVEATYRSSDLSRPRLGTADRRRGSSRCARRLIADVFFPPDDRQRRAWRRYGRRETPISRIWASSALRRRGDAPAEASAALNSVLSLNWQEERAVAAGCAVHHQPRADGAGRLDLATMPMTRSILAEGISLQVQFGGASKQVLSDQNFVRTYFRYSQGVPLSADRRAALPR